MLIEISIDKELLEFISFENKWGAISHILLKYEWKLIKYTKYGMFGHEVDVCKKGQPRRTWKSKNTSQTENEQQGNHTRRPTKEPVTENEASRQYF